MGRAWRVVRVRGDEEVVAREAVELVEGRMAEEGEELLKYTGGMQTTEPIPADAGCAFYCISCGYLLRGLSEDRCPECGRNFDRADPKAVARTPYGWRVRRWMRRSMWAACGVLLIAMGSGVAVIWPWYVEQEAIQAVEKLGGRVEKRRIGPPWLQKHLSPNLMFLAERANLVELGSILAASRERLRDSDLAPLAHLSHVYYLGLSIDNMTDAGLAYAAGAHEVRRLMLRNTNVTDAGLVYLKDMADLEELYLQETSVGDAGLVHLSGLKKLKSLYLPGRLFDVRHRQSPAPRITDAGIVHLLTLPSLEVLELDGTGITDAGLRQLESVPSLRAVMISNTAVTPEGVRHFREAMPRCKVYGP